MQPAITKKMTIFAWQDVMPSLTGNDGNARPADCGFLQGAQCWILSFIISIVAIMIISIIVSIGHCKSRIFLVYLSIYFLFIYLKGTGVECVAVAREVGNLLLLMTMMTRMMALLLKMTTTPVIASAGRLVRCLGPGQHQFCQKLHPPPGLHVKYMKWWWSYISLSIWAAIMTLTPFRSQKSVVCDEPSKSGGQSTLVAYLGGIDLTDGRYIKLPICQPKFFWDQNLI